MAMTNNNMTIHWQKVNPTDQIWHDVRKWARDAATSSLEFKFNLMPMSYVKKVERKRLLANWNKIYIEDKYGSNIKQLHPNVDDVRKFAPFVNKWLTMSLTGHGQFGKYLEKIGRRDDANCQCGLSEQSVHHLKFDCPLMNEPRYRFDMARRNCISPIELIKLEVVFYEQIAIRANELNNGIHQYHTPITIIFMPVLIGEHKPTVLSSIYLLLNNYHRFFTISLTPTQQITNTDTTLPMICLGSLQGGSRKQPRPSTVTTLLNRFSLNHQPEMKNKTVFLIIKTNFLLTECDPPMNIFSWSPSELSLPNWFQQPIYDVLLFLRGAQHANTHAQVLRAGTALIMRICAVACLRTFSSKQQPTKHQPIMYQRQIGIKRGKSNDQIMDTANKMQRQLGGGYMNSGSNDDDENEPVIDDQDDQREILSTTINYGQRGKTTSTPYNPANSNPNTTSGSSNSSTNSSVISRPSLTTKRDIEFVRMTLEEVGSIGNTIDEFTKKRIIASLEIVLLLQDEVLEAYSRLDAETNLRRQLKKSKLNDETEPLRNEINEIKSTMMMMNETMMKMNQQQQLTTTIIENQPALPPPPPPQSPTTYSGILKKAMASCSNDPCLKTVVTITGNDDAELTKREITNKVIPAQHGIRIKDTVKLRDGKFLVNFKSPSSKRKFENILAQDGKFKYSDSGRLQPTVHMKGLSVAYQEEMIPGLIALYNPEIAKFLDESGLEVDKVIEVKKKKQNPAKPHLCNVIMKVKPEIRNILINELNGRVNIEYSYIHVEDMSPLRQCFHCFGFKHIAEYCPRKNRQICLHCGGEHLISECMNREDAPTCLNCRIEQLPSQRNHMATSRDCPVMLRIMKNSLNQINYA
ncbi:hypothetical protein DERF_000844 [Dermatophagoides farinae]|uniref:Uncharacterized protein n=1 Tax=Dermatophagoides farinae TaxID=6954 RepID=A0A922I9P5_DERFA|nr:hypothetical protein DERF_000844 [Dermatophagoides farinae]